MHAAKVHGFVAPSSEQELTIGLKLYLILLYAYGRPLCAKKSENLVDRLHSFVASKKVKWCSLIYATL